MKCHPHKNSNAYNGSEKAGQDEECKQRIKGDQTPTFEVHRNII